MDPAQYTWCGTGQCHIQDLISGGVARGLGVFSIKSQTAPENSLTIRARIFRAGWIEPLAPPPWIHHWYEWWAERGGDKNSFGILLLYKSQEC